MKSKSSTPAMVAGALLVVAVIVFWVAAYSPAKSEANKLGTEAETLTSGLQTARSNLAQAESARRSFPAAYRQIVQLGQAIPSTDETSSMLVELTTLAAKSGARFTGLKLEGEEGVSEVPVIEGESVPATEVEAALMPLGSSIGGAGLGIMPYTLEFKGEYFSIAKFVGKLDDLVESQKNSLKVHGRLMTINGFSLTPEAEEGSKGEDTYLPPVLEASVSVTTYLTPPNATPTPGATPGEPTPEGSSEAKTVAAE
jgi:Tfp pilus assembly protein PilO